MSRRQVKRLLELRQSESSQRNNSRFEIEENEESDETITLRKGRISGRSIFTAAALLSSDSESNEDDEYNSSNQNKSATQQMTNGVAEQGCEKYSPADTTIKLDTQESETNSDIDIRRHLHVTKNEIETKRKVNGEGKNSVQHQFRSSRSNSLSSQSTDSSRDSRNSVALLGSPSTQLCRCRLLATDREHFKLSLSPAMIGNFRFIQEPVHQQGPQRRLAVQPRGGRMIRGPSLAKKYWLLPSAIEESWPRCDEAECLIMNIRETDKGMVFSFEEPKKYSDSRQQLIKLIEEGLGVQALPQFFQRLPFHLEANLVWVLILLQEERNDEAFQVLRRCLHSLQCSFHPKFSPFIVDSSSEPPWPQVVLESSHFSHALFFSTLFLYSHLLSLFGSHTTAFEIYKLLYSSDPKSDCTHSLLHLDNCCVRLKKVTLLDELCSCLFPGVLRIPSLWVDIKPHADLFLPNFSFSVAMARLRRCTEALKVAFFYSIGHPEVSPQRYCVFNWAFKSNDFSYIDHKNSDHREYLDDGNYFFVSDTYWDGLPSSDRKTSQLLLMRALILFPKFLQYVLQHFDISSSIIPQNSRSTLSWHDLIFSPAFSYGDELDAMMQRNKRIVQLATQRLVKAYILKSSKLLEPQAFLVFVHECSTIIHHQFTSDYYVEIQGQINSPTKSGPSLASAPSVRISRSEPSQVCDTDLKSQKTNCSPVIGDPNATTKNHNFNNQDENLLRWNQVKRRRTYREIIMSYRALWMVSLIQFYEQHNICGKYDDMRPEEFKDKVELPESLRLSLAEFAHILSRRDLGLRGTFRSPLCWLSLSSNPILLFFHSLIPYSAVDHKGTRTEPLTFRTLYKSFLKILVQPVKRRFQQLFL